MREIWAGLIGAAALFACGPALAFTQSDSAAAKVFPSLASPPAASEKIPQVTPGDEIAIACQALQYTKPDSDVRVVLTISATPGETATGYSAVMATDEQVLNGAVRVKVPDAPDLQNHTVNLDVYVVTDASHTSCDAGHIKVVQK